MDYLSDLYELCDIISRKVREAKNKIRDAGGELSGGDTEYIDKLTHTLKSIKTVIAMMEAENGASHRMGNNGGSSNRYGYDSDYYRDDYSRMGMRRIMPRRSGNGMPMYGGYSGHADKQEAVEFLREAMESAVEHIMNG